MLLASLVRLIIFIRCFASVCFFRALSHIRVYFFYSFLSLSLSLSFFLYFCFSSFLYIFAHCCVAAYLFRHRSSSRPKPARSDRHTDTHTHTRTDTCRSAGILSHTYSECLMIHASCSISSSSPIRTRLVVVEVEAVVQSHQQHAARTHKFTYCWLIPTTTTTKKHVRFEKHLFACSSLLVSHLLNSAQLPLRSLLLLVERHPAVLHESCACVRLLY